MAHSIYLPKVVSMILLHISRFLATAIMLTALCLPQASAQALFKSTAADHFIELITGNEPDSLASAFAAISEQWSPSYIPMTLEAVSYTQSASIKAALVKLLHDSTGQDTLTDINEWYFWLWNQNIPADSDYAEFKADLYKNIDSRFETYFRGRQNTARIRLDEIRWGGVRQDGIPPLRNPRMVSAQQAGYLDNDDVVFGISINGDARAYPKRILAWHEMFTDTIGGESIAGVYCTLCGTVIPYKTKFNGVNHELGTSGFLYRSNKLMYDKATQSLWSTSRGEPILGPLAGKGITLEFESVVTTTWGEWRRRHPDTTVLSQKTGYTRDYREGVAYANYFSSDRLMFNTPFKDQRLQNKREVLALRFAAAPDQQLAIDTEFLKANPVYRDSIGKQNFIVFTDNTGANRVYDAKDYEFSSFDGNHTVLDTNGQSWQLSEQWLEAPDGQRLTRLPYRRAFWFGWHAAFPETRLIK